MPRFVNKARPGLRTGRSESEPMVTAIRGRVEICEGLLYGGGRPLRSTRIASAMAMRGARRDSASNMELPRTVMCPILRAGFDSLPYLYIRG